MAEENQSLFTSFKDVIQRVQKDVSTGMELLKYRNQQAGLKRQQEQIFADLGRSIYKAKKGKKDIKTIVDDFYAQAEDIDKKMASLQRKITKLEKQNTTKTETKEPAAKTPAKKSAEKDTEES